MASLLEAVTPLADLVAHTPDPAAAVAGVRAAAPGGPAAVAAALTTAGADRRLLPAALAFAGAGPGCPQSELAAVAGALEVLVAQQLAGRVSLVLTVPEFLTAAHARFLADHPGVGARRTSGVIADIAAGAVRELTVAAPFLAAVAVEDLLPDVRRVLGAGGRVTVLTRALTSRCPEPSGANIAAVAAVRAAGDGRPGSLRVRSWEGPGLGVHLKAVVGDRADGYLGSANVTGGGQRDHVEAGVRLPRTLAAPLADWLDLLAVALTAPLPER
ncbi:hypothetical protein GB931_16995 [Modestobacter sp. I12A-02628]|uniref:PLD phosphodiesterase domain-containing protein n=1 Tax=Goekera deserti TaxID=2497753 RepID=A0A7K3WG00_9ACTN|nr:hypothetical protein [Goekera deserti]MPQ99582.1 hypothetical protein [Goekera deserti]NDI46407.1 hypothetical protein [Goekera deserti]NEL54660.1 hypothetical protein [Goekera deserti]